jgi:hypothetical protein
MSAVGRRPVASLCFGPACTDLLTCSLTAKARVKRFLVQMQQSLLGTLRRNGWHGRAGRSGLREG